MKFEIHLVERRSICNDQLFSAQQECKHRMGYLSTGVRCEMRCETTAMGGLNLWREECFFLRAIVGDCCSLKA